MDHRAEPGARLLLTRPEAASRRFLAACEAAWGGPIPALVSPVLAIRPVEVVLREDPAALILTSENGAARAVEMGLRDRPAWCVGPRTAAVARAGGLRAIEAGPNAEGLLAAMLAARPAGPILHLRGQHARGDVAARLRAGGLEARELVAYRQEARPPTPEARRALDADRPLVLPLFSPRSATLAQGWASRAPLHVVAMSPAVAVAAAPLGPASLDVARAPDGLAMVEAVLDRLAWPSPGLRGGAERIR
ncbi:uroporphyrinogen-III synthase [Rubellimicrobium aerolatum]|uniref:Uroporphyrinogen-III synthase n=1 Tax=Rubellimicrobium aerolatum TaxID=490979 RepID=A0ABW0SA34_9RHOB|nr:uroporphyrinogen-III synthase [Rubellimicrobium aerolatum]MBP1805116.1 uroporphyrinogen-III synthase [Rubellimicrobium aerolatum]